MTKLVYEYGEGWLVAPGVEGLVPLAPSWVRQKSDIPPRYQYCSLHPELSRYFKAVQRQAAVKYLSNFDDLSELGIGPLLLGATGAGKTYLAAGLLNEIILRQGEGYSFKTSWLDVQWKMQELSEMKQFGMKEDFFAAKNRFYDAEVLVIDDLCHVSESDFAFSKSFLFGLLEYRYTHKLPTIVTSNGDLDTITQVFNEPFTRRLKGVADEFIVKF